MPDLKKRRQKGSRDCALPTPSPPRPQFPHLEEGCVHGTGLAMGVNWAWDGLARALPSLTLLRSCRPWCTVLTSATPLSRCPCTASGQTESWLSSSSRETASGSQAWTSAPCVTNTRLRWRSPRSEGEGQAGRHWGGGEKGVAEPTREFWRDPWLVSEGLWPKGVVCPGLCGVRWGCSLSGLQENGSAFKGVENVYSES